VTLSLCRDRFIRRCNHRFASIFGYSDEALSGVSLAVLYPSQEEYDRTGAHWDKALRTKGLYADERIMKRRDGSLFWCRVRGQALDLASPLARSIWSFADISAERPVQALSKRERQVGLLMVEGLTAKEIARRLDISPRTVHVQKSRLKTRFGVRNSLELVRHLTSMPPHGDTGAE
tara:strand:+ start:471 stop:998 length:528 start_codon:yes stop_codon:yes gene_type:complete